MLITEMCRYGGAGNEKEHDYGQSHKTVNYIFNFHEDVLVMNVIYINLVIKITTILVFI